MKKLWMLIVCGASMGWHMSCDAGRMLVDEIIAIVPHKDGNLIICASDQRRAFDGSLKTIFELVIEMLLVIKARELGFVPTAAMMDTTLNNIQKRLHATLDDLHAMFASHGLTPEDARTLLQHRRMIEEVVGAMVRVEEPTHEEIVAYDDAHPVILPAQYTVQPGFVASDKIGKPALTKMLRTGNAPEAVEWYDEDTVEASRLQPDQRFVVGMKVGEIRLCGEVDGGYELIRLVTFEPERRKPLDEGAVAAKLRTEKFERALRVYQTELIDKGVIQWCSAAWKKTFEELCAEKGITLQKTAAPEIPVIDAPQQ